MHEIEYYETIDIKKKIGDILLGNTYICKGIFFFQKKHDLIRANIDMDNGILIKTLVLIKYLEF